MSNSVLMSANELWSPRAEVALGCLNIFTDVLRKWGLYIYITRAGLSMETGQVHTWGPFQQIFVGVGPCRLSCPTSKASPEYLVLMLPKIDV